MVSNYSPDYIAFVVAGMRHSVFHFMGLDPLFYNS